MNDKVLNKRKADSILNNESCFEVNKKSNILKKNDDLFCSINNIYRSNEYTEILQHAFQKDQNFLSSTIDNLSVNCEPFKYVILPNLIENEFFLKNLRDELLNDVEYDKKNNDLYSFSQSKDFKFLDLPCVKELRKCLLKSVLPLVQFITGFELYEDEIDLTASQYRYTDVLLCHDDKLEERRIAFILYLVDDWKNKFGGSLALFETDDQKQPKKIVKKITPKWNQFVFFPVTPQSFHEVSEVISKEKIRLTVHGWFQGLKSKFLIEPFIDSPITKFKCGEIDVEEHVFRDWINPKYLEPTIQIQIQNDFCLESSINLPNFLKVEKFQLLCSLLNENKSWKKVGPPNKKNFEVLDEDSCSSIIKDFLKVLKSQAMFLTLSNFTGIKLHPLAPDNESSEDESDINYSDNNNTDNDDDDDDAGDNKDNNFNVNYKNNSDNADEKMKQQNSSSPHCSIQIRKWQKGSYSLIHDYDPEVMSNTFKLDAILHLNHDFKTNRDQGGFISYFAKDENEELMCIEPESNYLSLVYLDPKTVRFVKYLNDSHPQTYHDVSMVFQK